MFWVALAFVWVGALASVAFLGLYLSTARWWSSPVGVSLVLHAAAMVALFARSAVVSTAEDAGPVSTPMFWIIVALGSAEALQAVVFYRRWWRTRRVR